MHNIHANTVRAFNFRFDEIHLYQNQRQTACFICRNRSVNDLHAGLTSISLLEANALIVKKNRVDKKRYTCIKVHTVQ